MKAQRQGTNLKIMIRMSLSALGRDTNEIKLDRLPIAALKELNTYLFKTAKAQKEANRNTGERETVRCF